MRGNRKLKAIDRYIGIVLVFLFGLLRRTKFNEIKKQSTVAFFAPVAIGDSVLIFSAIQSFIKKYEPKSVTVFCSPLTKGLVTLFLPEANIKVINITNIIPTIKTVRHKEFDHWFDFSQWARISSLISFFSRSKVRHGFKTRYQYRHHIYQRRVEHLDSIHEIENFLNLLDSKEFINEDRSLNLSQRDHNKTILVHICPSGERSYLKMWPIERWAEVVNNIISKGFNVAFTGAGSDDNEVQKVINLVKNKDNLTNLVNKVSIPDLPNLINNSKLLITVNTGILHIGSFTNTPIIALNGPTNPLRWGPISKNAISLKPSLKCAPCLNLGFEYGCNQNDCMKDISVKQVTDAIESLL